MDKFSLRQKLGLGLFLLLVFCTCYVLDRYDQINPSKEMTYDTYMNNTEQTTLVDQATTVNISTNMEQENKVLKEEPIKKVIYLTFDDGPSDNTIKVLDILREHNIKATFFMIGEEITPEREELVRSMIAEGHQIGVHTYTHEPDQMYTCKEACMKDFKKAYQKLIDVTGIVPTIYRFPYGSANCYITSYCNLVIREMDALGLAYIDWNVTGEDAIGNPTAESILKNIKRFKKYNEPVVLLHDGKNNDLTVKVLPTIIKNMEDAGYEFDIIANRYRPYQWTHKWQDTK